MKFYQGKVTARVVWWATLALYILVATVMAYTGVPVLFYHVIPSVMGRVAEVYDLTLPFDPIFPIHVMFGFLLSLLVYLAWQAMFVPRWYQMAVLDPVDKWCRQCARYVPTTAEHCTLCNLCVVYRCHHSFLINNCVGENNVVLYHLMLTVFMLMGASTLFFVVMDAFLSHSYRLGYALSCAVSILTAARLRGRALRSLIEMVRKRDI